MAVQKIRPIIILVLALLIFSAPAVYAYDHDPSPKDEKGWTERKEAGRERLYKDLDLNDVQKKSLEENRNKNKEKMKALFEEMRTKKDAMRQELQKTALDMGKISQINNDLKRLQAQMLDDKLERILEVRKILTPEQFKKFTAKMEERASHFKDKHKGL